ncbi:DNA-binding MarR family transcriptional regulator [Friedmanniella endophytica]|uniref:DNA-binding MarR family transcriptional regulator n=1 Tax=Microlunatus kandeliicorticis TaxID=1759536 RepID=A0A7W3IU87_9ACTN|nr:MarR family winged helix-turn-helix transcriptional regulator [Microlunatus kandeliicorticis]MBA8795371.1 DNA-binding MarR family transcriptional regulator [Microlunatus kandeliicorticis]
MTDGRQQREVGPPGPAAGAVPIGLALRDLLATYADVQDAMGRSMGMSPGDVAALDVIVRAQDSPDGVIGPGELARRLGITTASATVMVDRLEARGHLLRQRHPRDRRRVELHLTESARDEVVATLRPLNAALARLTDGLDPDRAAAVLDYLRGATAVLRAYADRRDEGDDPSA